MPPRRRLTDLCWMAVFKQLKPKDQVKASRMNSRCAILVRAANRRVRTLIITGWGGLKTTKRNINSYSLASKPCMQQLPNVNELPLVGDYPMTTRVSKWNCLNIRHLPTTEELVTIFSAVTDFKFILVCIFGRRENKNFQCLVDLLRHPIWARQMTNLMIGLPVSEDDFPQLCAAINGLSALEYLAIDFGGNVLIPELPILARLKVISMNFWEENLPQFLLSLERQATANVALRMHLLSYCNIENLLGLSEPLCNRIARIKHLRYTAGLLTPLSPRFTSLTSLDVSYIDESKVGPLFTALSQLSQLIHLKLFVSFMQNRSFEELPWSFRPQAQLKSVRALTLSLSITSHSQVLWLNLQQTLPHLQAIQLNRFRCDSCKVDFYYYLEGLGSPNALKTDECLRASLLPHLHLGVHPGRIIFQLGNDRSPFLSFDQL